MKNIYKYSIVLLAALLCAPMTTLADVDPNDPSITRGNGVVLKKTVRDATTDEKGEYILTLEAYATGTSATVITEETDAQTIPCDIVLLLDESGSMRANWFIQNKKGSAAIGELSADEVYIVNIDGKDYYMKGFYNNEEYQLTTTLVGGDYISQTQTGTNISYNNVGSNKYVQYTDGKYYLVSREYTQSGSGSNKIYTYYLYITVDGAKKYLSDTNFSTDKPTEMPTYKGWNNQGSNTNIWTGEYITGNTLSYSSLGSNTNRYILYGGKYCQVLRGGGSNNRNLYITVNGQTRYLQNNDVLDAGASAPTGKNDNAVIWTGGYYIYEGQPIGPSALTFNSVCPSTNTIPTTTIQYNAPPYDVTLNGTDYYVKYNGNYYKVEACYYNWNSSSSSGSNTYYLTINIGGQKLYLNGTSPVTAATGNSSRTANIWTGDIYMKSASGDMTFVYNETIPTSASDGTVCYTGSTAPAASDITVGTVYSTSTQFITREQIAKAAAKEFVQTVYANNPNVGEGNDRYHQVSVGWYSGEGQNGWLYSNALTLLSSTSIVSSFQTAIDGVAPSGTGTKIDLAMQNAYNLLNTGTVKNDGRNKIVVLFTDGEPGTTSKTFSTSTARTAVTYANQIKDEFDNTFEGNTYEAKVYSIGFLDKETSNGNDGNSNNTNDIRRFLHYLSSNYNIGSLSGTTYNFTSNYSGAGGGDEAPHDYYIYSDGSNLSTIFQTVASQAASGQTTGGASRQLEANTTTVLDIISEEFRLPTDITTTVGDFVKVYTMHVVSDESSENNYVWAMDDHSQADPTIAYSKEERTLNDIVRVNGFDFTKADEYNDEETAIETYGHWVGPRTIGNTTTYAGHKLVIEIPIIKADNYNGGFNTPTNTSSSALVYVNPDNNNKEEKVLAFAIPDLDFPSLAIAKSGLEPGESAIFTVKQLSGWNEDGTKLVDVTNGISYTVIVTNDGTEIERNISDVTDVNGSLSKTVDGTEYWYEIIKDIPEGMYQVTETRWSWTYTTTIPQHESYTTVGTNAIQQEVTKDQITANHANGNGEFKGWGDNITKKIIIFEFNNSKKESVPANGEDSKKNVFKGGDPNGGNTDENTDVETEP